MGLFLYENGKIPEAIAALENSLDHVSEISEEEDRQRYSEALSAILRGLRANPSQKLALYSQLDDKVSKAEREAGIQVPFEG